MNTLLPWLSSSSSLSLSSSTDVSPNNNQESLATLQQFSSLLTQLDACCSASESAVRADKAYVASSRASLPRKVVVETAHPYAQGRDLLKQTVSIPGATSLLLSFDAQCRTAATGSDFLMVFAGTSDSGTRIPLGDNGQVIKKKTLNLYTGLILIENISIGSIGRQCLAAVSCGARQYHYIQVCGHERAAALDCRSSPCAYISLGFSLCCHCCKQVLLLHVLVLVTLDLIRCLVRSPSLLSKPLVSDWRLDVAAQVAHVIGTSVSRALSHRASDQERCVKHWLSAPFLRAATIDDNDVASPTSKQHQIANEMKNNVGVGAKLVKLILSKNK